jgi:hypothetical protein
MLIKIHVRGRIYEVLLNEFNEQSRFQQEIISIMYDEKKVFSCFQTTRS